MDREIWEPASADDLTIGDHIRIDHRWFDHPFERRMFRISSDKEIATIRDQELTRVFVDRAPPEEEAEPQAEAQAEPQPEAAEQAAPEQAAAPDGAAAQETPAPASDKSSPEEAAEAAREAARLAEQREALEAARARDRHTRELAQQTLGMLSAGHQDSAVAVAGLVDYLVAILNNSTTPIAPLSPTAPRHSKVRLALLGSDAVWLAGLIGKRMGLAKPELRALTHAAAVHAVGLTRMPPNLAEEGTGIEVLGTPLANYPAYSALILQQCGGFPAEVLRIVSEHRERPDGSGFPRKLQGEKIHPHALIIGAVRELQVLCAASAVAPAVALARIYKSLRDTYGAVITNHLAAAVLLIPVGTYVQLSDGSVARVLRINEAKRLSPVVENFGPGATLHAPQEIDLSQRPDVFIVRALDTSKLPPKMFDAIRNTGPDALPPNPHDELPPVEGEQPEPAEAPSDDAGMAQASGA